MKQLLISAALVCVAVSCTKEKPVVDTSNDLIGILTGNDEAANEAVKDLRLVSCGDDCVYEYDKNGSLTAVIDNYSPLGFKAYSKNNFTIEKTDRDGNRVVVSFDIKDGVIQSILSKVSMLEFTAALKYNPLGQISSIRIEGGGDNAGRSVSYEALISMNYDISSHRLRRIIGDEWTKNLINNEVVYSTSSTTAIEYEYTRKQQNTFCQYTPYLANGILLPDPFSFLAADMFYFESFVYVGLFGKASYEIPTGETDFYMWSENGEARQEITNTYELSCSFNSDGTISNADNYAYKYVKIGTRGSDTGNSSGIASERHHRPHRGSALERQRRFLLDGATE